MPDPKVQTYRFDEFLLDAADRQLWRGAERVDLNARYFDALVLLVREAGQLVGKEQFFEEVWSDVVVSDSALTQCIRTLRQQLGDDAADPRFIQTVPRFGYRFIAPVEAGPTEAEAEVETPQTTEATAPSPPSDGAPSPPSVRRTPAVQHAAFIAGVGTLGGAVAGVLGGLVYGAALAYTPADSGLGTTSLLAVLLGLNVLVGLIGGTGVSAGIAAVRLVARHDRWSVLGAAGGGLIVGSVAKLLGVDAFTLLFGTAPVGMTGGLEGAALGAAVVVGARVGERVGPAAPWRIVAGAGLAGAITGALIPLAGGRLMGGSLALLSQAFAGSQLRLDALGRFFGEARFGPVTEIILSGVEGLLFCSCIAAALLWAAHTRAPAASTPAADAAAAR